MLEGALLHLAEPDVWDDAAGVVSAEYAADYWRQAIRQIREGYNMLTYQAYAFLFSVNAAPPPGTEPLYLDAYAINDEASGIFEQVFTPDGISGIRVTNGINGLVTANIVLQDAASVSNRVKLHARIDGALIAQDETFLTTNRPKAQLSVTWAGNLPHNSIIELEVYRAAPVSIVNYGSWNGIRIAVV